MTENLEARLELELEALDALSLRPWELEGLTSNQRVKLLSVPSVRDSESMPAQHHMEAAVCLAKTSHLFSDYLRIRAFRKCSYTVALQFVVFIFETTKRVCFQCRRNARKYLSATIPICAIRSARRALAWIQRSVIPLSSTANSCLPVGFSLLTSLLSNNSDIALFYLFVRRTAIYQGRARDTCKDNSDLSSDQVYVALKESFLPSARIRPS
ncbi:hypothetical protein EDB85DRAFT_654312 [Lactarius pseudohatsudake]|nr:hypothetical protein EDB85DRAFT_654312 [Lactarius pseudohatsudake]